MAIKLFLITVSLLFAFVLSAAEVAFYSLTSAKEQVYGNLYGRLFKSPQLLLSTILVSNAAAVFLFALLGASIAIEVSTTFSVSRTISLGIEVVVVSGVLIIFGDAVPKIAAARNAKLVARLSMPLLAVLLIIESPIVFPLNSLLSRINARRKKSSLTIDSKGLKILSQIAARAGVIEENEAELLGKISFLGEKTVRDAMTMRAEIASISDEIKFDEVVEALRKSEHSRLPVFSGTPDNVVGMLYARDFLHNFRRKTHPKKFDVRTLMRKPVFVPETQSLERLIETFKANMVHIAVVVDEFGGLAGIVTFSDVVREIFGSSAESPRKGLFVTKLPDNSLLIKGNARLDEIASEIRQLAWVPSGESFEIDAESAETISSFLVRQYGSVPRVGSKIEFGDFEFEIDQATPKAILQVKLRMRQSEPSSESHEGTNSSRRLVRKIHPEKLNSREI